MKNLRTIIVCATVLALVAAGAAAYMNSSKLRDLFSGLFSSELKIDDTANVVTEIKNISEFVCVCFYDEVVLDETKSSDNLANNLMSKIGQSSVSTDELCLIANGKVRAGFDLSKVAESDLRISHDTLMLSLPEAEIFDVIVNPSNFEIYVEDGSWSHEQVVAVEGQAKEKIRKEAIESGILEKANTIGRQKLVDMFKTFGFKAVVID